MSRTRSVGIASKTSGVGVGSGLGVCQLFDRPPAVIGVRVELGSSYLDYDYLLNLLAP